MNRDPSPSGDQSDPSAPEQVDAPSELGQRFNIEDGLPIDSETSPTTVEAPPSVDEVSIATTGTHAVIAARQRAMYHPPINPSLPNGGQGRMSDNGHPVALGSVRVVAR